MRSRTVSIVPAMAAALGFGLVTQAGPVAAEPQLSEGCTLLHQFDPNDGVVGSPGTVHIPWQQYDAGEQVRFVGNSDSDVGVRVHVDVADDAVDIDGALGEVIRVNINVSGGYAFTLSPLGSGNVNWHPGCGVPPTPVISQPAGGGTYQVGQYVPTAFGCSVETNALATCVDSKSSAPPVSSLDTSTVGQHTYTVTATDSRGLQRKTSISYTVAKASQTVSFTSVAPTDAVVFEGPYFVSASATSGLPVAFSVDEASADICWVMPGPGGGGMVSFIGVGTCTIHADQAGNDQYEAAARVSQSFEIHKTPTSLAAQKACKCLGLTPTTFKATLSWSHPMGPGTITEGLPGQTVNFVVKGKTVCSATTDSSGLATCKATLGLGVALTAGSYTATYAGTDRFQAATTTAKLE